ncbi:MAG: O-antigen ligase family protein [Planctomycetota bacterium]|nr:O-antigen ligase family protein [Planctomycetota bacterium]
MNGARPQLLEFLLPTLFGLGCGVLYLVLGVSDTFQAMLVLTFLGVFGLFALSRLELVRQALLLGFGFAVVINPRKFFGVSDDGDMKLLAWTVTVLFVTALDIGVFALLLGYARNFVAVARRALPGLFKLLLVGFFVIMFVSLANAGDRDIAWAHIAYEGKNLALFLVVVALAADRGNGGTADALRWILIGLGLAMGLEMMIVGLEYLGVIPNGWGFVGIRVGSQIEALGDFEALRVGGTYQHPNYLSIAAAAMALVFWQVLMDSDEKRRSSVFYWLGFFGSVVCLVLTLSRAGWLGCFAGGLLYTAVMLKLRGMDWLRGLPWKYIVPALFVLLAVGLYFIDPIFDKLFHSSPLNISSRSELNDMALQAISTQPWIGWGIGQHGFAMQDYGRSDMYAQLAGLIPVAHNIYLLVVSEIGIVGGGVYFLIPAYAITHGIRTCAKAPDHELSGALCAFSTALVVFLVADFFGPGLRKVDVANLYWLLLALVFGVAMTVREDAENASGRRTPGRPASTECEAVVAHGDEKEAR